MLKDKNYECYYLDSIQQAQVIGKTVTMSLAEKEIELNGTKLREIRKLSDSGHQTSILTTHFQINPRNVAGYMFSRWSQENFFRYMMEDYDLDRVVEYGVEQAVAETRIVNPSYRKLSAETALTNMISPCYSRAEQEGRMLIKEIIKSDADIIPDYVNRTLTVKLHPLSTPRASNEARKLCELITQSETYYPETDLKMRYEVLE